MMKLVNRTLGWVFVIATLLVALLLGAFLAWGLTEGVPAGTAIVIDGERFVVADIADALAAWWPLVALVVLVLAGTIVVLLPILFALSVGLPALAGVLSLVFALLALALVTAPVWLPAWWLWKRSKPKAHGATMHA